MLLLFKCTRVVLVKTRIAAGKMLARPLTSHVVDIIRKEKRLGRRRTFHLYLNPHSCKCSPHTLVHVYVHVAHMYCQYYYNFILDKFKLSFACVNVYIAMYMYQQGKRKDQAEREHSTSILTHMHSCKCSPHTLLYMYM